MGYVPSVADLVHQLRSFHGYRTLWLDERGGGLVHTEPEEELETQGYVYVATLMRPTPEVLAEALLRVGMPLGITRGNDASSPGWAAAAEPLSA